MKKVWLKLSRQELLLNFIAYAALVCLAGGFLIFLIIKIMDNRFHDLNAKPIGLFIAVVFIIILLAGISFYRLSMSNIRRYKNILDSIPMPVIVTDKNVVWTQINEAAREIMTLERDSELGKLNSMHLINQNGSVMEKTLANNGTEYRISGFSFDEGYMIFLNSTHRSSDSNKTRTELIDEINKLLGQMSTATDQFHDCASSLAGYTIRQADIISELTNVITGIASGEYQEADTLNEKMYVVKANMEQHVESNQVSLETIRQTVIELDTTRDRIGNVLNNIDSGS